MGVNRENDERMIQVGKEISENLNSVNIATGALNKKLDKLNKVIEDQTENLIESNNKHSRRITWLTGALVFVGAVTAMAALASSWPHFMKFFS